ncbi:F-box/FBD/LRR-repeat protein At1g13570-like [Lycium ferocissimum]|uniref:F-box/FBD/LRR-repeat protein At1g13570-like n=1 Tax=Lycium ferocissimum TaxID=112874 RepID=UPI002815772B|nr:F-box/FBD/LRR-repeat protein At1g13570-like [Lycium ferocissimum]
MTPGTPFCLLPFLFSSFWIINFKPQTIQLLILYREGAVAVEGDTEDRISALPRNVIDGILSLLPVHDAARTSILSKNWRYIWAMLPNLVLDNHFCNKLALKSQSVLKETVDEILLEHLGYIVKFVLDMSGTHLTSSAHIDRWMRFVTRNNVKELILDMPDNSTYKLPSHVFNCPTLSYLELCNSLFKPPNSFLGFQNLINLYLNKVTFVSTPDFPVINAPLLVKLTLTHCNGTQNLNIVVSSRLKYLSVRESHYNLDLNRFMTCKKLTCLYLAVESPIPADKRSTHEKIIFSLSTLEVLTLASHFLELLSAGAVPNGLPITLNCLWHLRLGVNFSKLGQTSYTLELIKNSPNLRKLEIWDNTTSDPAKAVMKYLDTPACLDRTLNKLRDVSVHHFRRSKTVLSFVKLLFAHAPSLLRMSIMPTKASDSKEELNIATELMRLPRVSPKAELCYHPIE